MAGVIDENGLEKKRKKELMQAQKKQVAEKRTKSQQRTQKKTARVIKLSQAELKWNEEDIPDLRGQKLWINLLLSNSWVHHSQRRVQMSKMWHKRVLQLLLQLPAKKKKKKKKQKNGFLILYWMMEKLLSMNRTRKRKSGGRRGGGGG
jgi:hypothetical protein